MRLALAPFLFVLAACMSSPDVARTHEEATHYVLADVLVSNAGDRAFTVYLNATDPRGADILRDMIVLERKDASYAWQLNLSVPGNRTVINITFQVDGEDVSAGPVPIASSKFRTFAGAMFDITECQSGSRFEFVQTGQYYNAGLPVLNGAFKHGFRSWGDTDDCQPI